MLLYGIWGTMLHGGRLMFMTKREIELACSRQTLTAALATGVNSDFAAAINRCRIAIIEMREMITCNLESWDRIYVCAVQISQYVDFAKAFRHPTVPVTRAEALRGLHEIELIVIGSLAMEFHCYPRKYPELVDRIQAMRPKRIWFIEDWR